MKKKNKRTTKQEESKTIRPKVDPRVKISTKISLSNGEEKIIEKEFNVNDYENYEQMEKEAIKAGKKAEEELLRNMVKKKKKHQLKYIWKRILNMFGMARKK